MKIAIIGVGTVGSAVATAVKNTGFVHEIVLFDRDAIRARAAAEDLGHAGLKLLSSPPVQIKSRAKAAQIC